MKTLKWLWWVVLLTIGFKTYSMLSSGPSGYNPNDMDSFIGMVLIFAFLSVALFVFWIIGRAKEKITGKIPERKGSGE